MLIVLSEIKTPGVKNTLNSASALSTQYFQTLTLHSTLYTLHSTLYTLHSTLYTQHSTLYTLNSTLSTLHILKMQIFSFEEVNLKKLS